MRTKRLFVVAAMAAASVLLGTTAASAIDVFTPGVTTGCVDVSSGGARVTTSPVGAQLHPHSVTIHSVGDCI